MKTGQHVYGDFADLAFHTSRPALVKAPCCQQLMAIMATYVFETGIFIPSQASYDWSSYNVQPCTFEGEQIDDGNVSIMQTDHAQMPCLAVLE